MSITEKVEAEMEMVRLGETRLTGSARNERSMRRLASHPPIR